jgi:hypothetical protein
METIKRKTNFENAGYYFIGLLIIVLLGFWPSYFSRFFDGTADFNSYFHFHAVTAFFWLILLIVQPTLIHKKKIHLHKALGKLSYILIPLIFISVMLLAHNRITGNEEDLGLSLWIPFKDLFVLTIAYFIAIKYRHNIQIHARGMIAAGIVLIEPALVRFILNTFFPESGFAPEGYLATIFLIYLLFAGLIFAERKQKVGRWVFPLILGTYIFVHSVIIFQIQIGPWQAFAKWFASLPLT